MQAASFWNDWLWVLWLGIIFLSFSSLGHWGYLYRTNRRYSEAVPRNEAIDILSARYAKGEITHEVYAQMKSAILGGLQPAAG